MVVALIAGAVLAAIAVYVLGAMWTCTEREVKGPRVLRRWRSGLGHRHECVSLLKCPVTWHDTETGAVSFLSDIAAEMERLHQEAEDADG